MAISVGVNSIGPIFFPVDNRTTTELLDSLEMIQAGANNQMKLALTAACAPFQNNSALAGIWY
jgi:hypothetical protein